MGRQQVTYIRQVPLQQFRYYSKMISSAFLRLLSYHLVLVPLSRLMPRHLLWTLLLQTLHGPSSEFPPRWRTSFLVTEKITRKMAAKVRGLILSDPDTHLGPCYACDSGKFSGKRRGSTSTASSLPRYTLNTADMLRRRGQRVRSL